MKPLALMPARGGSKRIPRKNVIDFCGMPMLSHPIAAARASGLFDVIHVSTDDDEIAAAATAAGADASLRRPAHLADDVTPLLPVARWVVQALAEGGQKFLDVFILFPCSPLLDAADLRGAYEVYLAHERQRNLLTVARSPVPVEWYYRRAQDGRLTPTQPGGAFIRSQDLAPAYYETGTFTIFSTEWLLNAQALADDTNYISYELPSWKAVDIDTLEDLERAKMLYRAMGARGV